MQGFSFSIVVNGDWFSVVVQFKYVFIVTVGAVC